MWNACRLKTDFFYTKKGKILKLLVSESTKNTLYTYLWRINPFPYSKPGFVNHCFSQTIFWWKCMIAFKLLIRVFLGTVWPSRIPSPLSLTFCLICFCSFIYLLPLKMGWFTFFHLLFFYWSKLLYSVVLVSAVQEVNAYICVSPPSWTSLPLALTTLKGLIHSSFI